MEGVKKSRSIIGRFLRWILEMGQKTPGYLVREELQKNKMRERVRCRTWEYEKRGKWSELVTACWKEIKERKENRSISH